MANACVQSNTSCNLTRLAGPHPLLTTPVFTLWQRLDELLSRSHCPGVLEKGPGRFRSDRGGIVLVGVEGWIEVDQESIGDVVELVELLCLAVL